MFIQGTLNLMFNTQLCTHCNLYRGCLLYLLWRSSSFIYIRAQGFSRHTFPLSRDNRDFSATLLANSAQLSQFCSLLELSKCALKSVCVHVCACVRMYVGVFVVTVCGC